MHSTNDGYATGSKDGIVILWDVDFKPITKLDLVTMPMGYEGGCDKLKSVTFQLLSLITYTVRQAFHLSFMGGQKMSGIFHSSATDQA